MEVLVLCGCEQNPSALKLAKKFAKECRVQHAVLIPRPEDGRNHKDQQRDQKLFLTDFYRCILRGKTVKGVTKHNKNSNSISFETNEEF